jgi:hypothetical protein
MSVGAGTAQTKFLLVINRKVDKDPLRKGELGINIHTCVLTNDLVSDASLPRFIVVIMSYFASSDEALLNRFVARWSESVQLFETLKGMDTDAGGRAKQTMEDIVRQYAVQTFPRISALKFLLDSGVNYKAASKMEAWIDDFFKKLEDALQRVQERLDFATTVDRIFVF